MCIFVVELFFLVYSVEHEFSIVYWMMTCGCIQFVSWLYVECDEARRSRYPPDFTYEFSTRVVSIYHVLLVTPIAIMYLWASSMTASSMAASSMGASSMWVLMSWQTAKIITTAYLLYDALQATTRSLLYVLPNDVATLCHHLPFYLGITFVHGDPYEWYTALAYLAEISTPILYITWYMYKLNLQTIYPKAWVGCTIALLITFFLFRVINFSWLLYSAAVKGVSLLATPFIAALWLMNIVWFWLLCSKVIASRKVHSTQVFVRSDLRK